MPWKEITTMSQRKEFVELAKQENSNMSELCRRYGISRKTGYKWLKRYLEIGNEGIENRSRRPHTSPGQTSKEMEEMILELREKHPAWGGRKIKAFLEHKGYNLPAASTITSILQRNQQIAQEESQKHRAFLRYEMEQPNQLWQMDFKGYFRVEKGNYCHPLTVLDDHSRYLLGLRACENQKYQTVQAQLTDIFRSYGIPERMLMDNGSPWGDDADSRHTIFTAWLLRLDIKVSHGRPYHPQTQGKDERLHRTLQAELLSRQSFPDLIACQSSFNHWRHLYNHERPHEALNLFPPISRYQPSHRSFPEVLPPILYPFGDIIRKVDIAGKISYKNRVFRIGKAFRKQPVALRPTDVDGLFDVFYCSHKVSQIDLSATKP